jgi:hypothetical protein
MMERSFVIFHGHFSFGDLQSGAPVLPKARYERHVFKWTNEKSQMANGK